MWRDTFYADYCSGKLWALRYTNGVWQSTLVLETKKSISSFDEDEACEVYLTSLCSGELFRLVGDRR